MQASVLYSQNLMPIIHILNGLNHFCVLCGLFDFSYKSWKCKHIHVLYTLYTDALNINLIEDTFRAHYVEVKFY